MARHFSIRLIIFVMLLSGPILAQTNTARMLSGVNAQTGASYTFTAADSTRLTTFSNAGVISATLPSGSTNNFGAGSLFSIKNIGVGNLSITCSGCTINGAGSLVLTTGQGADLYSDGLNYVAQSGSGGGGGGTGNVTTTPGAGVSQFLVQKSGTSAGSNLWEQMRFVDASWNWIQTDSAGSIGNLSVAGSNTLNLVSCPLGINASGFTASQYAVYISGVGTPEAVPVTGGTCISGAASGTIIVTTNNTHGAGFSVGSATQGIQEAINDGCRGGPTNYGSGSIGGNCDIELQPAGFFATPNYTIQAPIYVDARSQRVILNGNGALLGCNTRSFCLFSGNFNAGTSYNVIQNMMLTTNLNIDGVQIADVTAASGVYTVHTASAHPFSMTANAGQPDFVDIMFNVTEAGGSHFQPHAVVQLTSVADNTHFTFTLGSTTFPNATGFGYTALENTMIEDNADGTVMRDVKYRGFGTSSTSANYVIVIDNDQAAVIDHLTTSGSGVRCTTNFCGAILYSRGDNGNSSIIQLTNSELSMQCQGNGILARGGNGLYIENSVIQGFAQYGLISYNGLHATSIKDVHFEASNCNNPLYNLSLANVGAILDGGINSYEGTAPFPDGAFPKFVTGGSVGNQRNYFIVVHSSALGVTIPIPVGFALPVNGSVTIPVSWPAVISSINLGTVTYDVLVTVNGGAQTPLTGTGNFSIATGISGSCGTNGMCSFSDTQAASGSYTVAAEQWYPGYWYMPGGAVLSNVSGSTASQGATISIDNAQWGRFTGWSKKIPMVYARHWEPSTITGSNGMIGPMVVEAYATSQTGPGNFSFFLNQKDAGNNGPPVNSKGRINLGSEVVLLPNHLLTWKDSNFDKTASTVGMRPTNDANDCYTGEDQSGGLSFGCNTSISNYIANVGDGTNWKERLTATQKLFAVPPVPSTAAGVDIGAAALPFANLWLGTAATNNFKFQPAATAAARVISMPDPLQATNLGLNFNATNGFYQSKRGTAGCTTSGGATPFTGACTTVVTFPASFADTNFSVTCMGRSTFTGVPLLQGATATANNTVTVQTQQATGVNASFATIDCIAVHD